VRTKGEATFQDARLRAKRAISRKQWLLAHILQALGRARPDAGTRSSSPGRGVDSTENRSGWRRGPSCL